jgi:uncharacterized protein (DUF1778 family)
MGVSKAQKSVFTLYLQKRKVFVYTNYNSHRTRNLCIHRKTNMPTSASKSSTARVETINLRVSRSQKALIDRAAQALGRKRSDFMLEAACREAEGVLLDRRYFALPAEEFKRFIAMLDKAPASNPRLTRLLKTRAPWDK